jgi:riboflavin biosynthesis pyrimidine reductase
MPRVLAEGGPHLFGDLLAADLVDELALTLAPALAGGDPLRVVAPGGTLGRATAVRHVLEEDSSLLTLWRIRR